ncbi:hypothetical protein ACFV9C_01610 [Kribbella sp. NPDC059898]|uniref:hypothetical protein n=1 Tax=Kribbella sp. NPDC059898 TaxID=3346995 RepID=UPI003660C42F
MNEFLLLDGARLPTVDPRLLRATSFGHFTSLQVRDGHVDGLDLHFERLDRSTHELFDRPLPADRVRADLRADLTTYDAAYLTNSTDPALPVASVNDVTYEYHPESANAIAKAYAAVTTQPI